MSARGWRDKSGQTHISVKYRKEPFPDQYHCKMRYVDNLTFGSAVATSSSYDFNGNSLFDPDRSGVGDQPYGFDQIKAVYGAYRVDACKMKVTFTNITTHDIYVGIAAGTLADTALFDTVAEWKYIPFATKLTHLGPNTSGLNTATLKFYIETAKVFGIDADEIRDSSTYRAIVGASPAGIFIMRPFAANVDPLVASLGTVAALVEITYYTTFLSRVPVGPS